MNVKSIFIVWAHHSRRAETLATELNGQVSFQYEARLKGGWLTPLRYLVQGWKTWHLLEREQPEVVLVQSPPIFAPLVVTLWCELRGTTRPTKHRSSFAIDCHPSTFYCRDWRWALPLLRFLTRRANVTLSSNMEAQNILQRWKVRGFFLADGVPSLAPPTGTIGSEGEARVAVISTFADVEPIAEVFAAARLLPQVTFYLTGDQKRASAKLLAQKPENVILTGFLRGGTYTALLKNVHGMVILTNQPKDLSCAAYEAVAMAKPAVVSDGPENKRWFTQGFVYVNNTPEAIAAGINKMLNEQVTLIPEVIAMGLELTARRRPTFEEFAALLLESLRQAKGKEKTFYLKGKADHGKNP
ncbi:MAG: glycosyltransferase family 4 protein [Chloroflexi bacterium]|nr:MAG: glycosyltransferase family 4 protein [Chloroflexota bacterium]